MARCAAPARALCPAHRHTSAHADHADHTLRLVLQASMTAEERELMEEAEAIKAAQRTAKEILGFQQEETKKKVNKAQDKITAPSNRK